MVKAVKRLPLSEEQNQSPEISPNVKNDEAEKPKTVTALSIQRAGSLWQLVEYQVDPEKNLVMSVVRGVPNQKVVITGEWKMATVRKVFNEGRTI